MSNSYLWIIITQNATEKACVQKVGIPTQECHAEGNRIRELLGL